ncbi:hypothetical protein G6O67_004217 [Ophiocordyceps sinensis]|uniref:Allergen Asp F4-like protein n=2 Tax=Ophiocordyceps sinensis TaxID=72228 RepID=A0A8H4LYC9_9HYPO|nr:allergen Asp F4-like protein [Ophiocordyceps sinensis CO18]KAF4507754.1 hypothetical protein G6O67_004217 [Ophiocordyceps sinensis]
MKVSATTLFLAAALGVSAHPSGHAHKHLHRSMYLKAMRPNPSPLPAYSPPETTASAVQYTADPTPSPPEHEQLPPNSTSGPDDSDDNGLGLSTEQPLCPKKQKRDTTYADIVTVGNTGGEDFGCNLQRIQASLAPHYPYTIKLINDGGKEQECACSLKKAKNGGPNSGTFKGGELFKFTLQPRKYQYLAADPDTKGSCTCAAGTIPTNKYGQYANSWVEFDFASEVNGNEQVRQSGTDASCLTSLDAQLGIQGMHVSRHGSSDAPSIICPGASKGSINSYYAKDLHSKGGIGLNMRTEPDEKICIVVHVDYQC